MIRMVIINALLGGCWGWLLGRLGATLNSELYWFGMLLLFAVIVNSLIH